jgi:hypothetical protein
MNWLRKNQKSALALVFSLVATVALAAGFERIPKDTVLLGTGTTANKMFEFDLGQGSANPKIRAKNSSPFLEFAPDGVTYAPIGSADTVSVNDTNFSLKDDGDATKLLKFEASGITTGTTRTLTAPDANGTIGLVPASGLVRSSGTALTGAGTASLTSEVTGILPIANGGTNASTANAALANISGMTVKGDLITRDASSPAVLGIGTTNGQVLTVDSTNPVGMKWADSGAGGSGELNMVTNPSAASAVTGWSATGGTWAAPTRTTTSGDLPLENQIGTALKLTSPTSALAEASHYISTTLTPGEALKNRKLKVEFYMRPGTNFIAGEWTVSVYSGSTRMPLSTDSSGFTYLPSATGKFTTYFDTDSSTSYTLRFARPINAATNAGVVNLTNIIVGPGIQASSAAVSAWQTFTPTFTNVSIGNGVVNGRYRRVGDSIDLQYSLVFGSTTSVTGVIRPNLPLSLTIDTTKKASHEQYSGWAYAYDNSAAVVVKGMVRTGNGYLSIAATTAATGSSAASSGEYTATLPFTWATSDELYADVRGLPIAEWSGSGTVNVAQNDVEYASNSNATSTATDTTSFAYGPNGSLVINAAAGTLYTRRVRFISNIQPTDRLVLEVLDAAGATWTPAEARLGAFVFQSSSAYGASLGVISSTDIEVYFQAGGARPSGATYASTGANWSDFATWRWRVRKFSGGQAVGFGLATATESGLVGTGAQTFGGDKTLNGKMYISENAPTNFPGMFRSGESGTIAAAGTYDITVTPSLYFGMLGISCNNIGNGNIQTQKLVHVSWQGGGGGPSPTNITSVNGSGGGCSYTVGNPSAGIIRITNSSACTGASPMLCKWFLNAVGVY